jgi:predicted ribosome quality control (RQC) complex YloA/Tae2 family protein
MELSNNNELWLKGFGKFGNVLLRDKINDETISLFRLSLKSDWEFKYPILSTTQTSELIVKEPKPEELSELHINSWPLSIDDLVQAELHFMRDYYFERNKLQLIDGLEKKIKHYKKIISESQRRLKDIETRRSNKELGDLILAHSHSLKPGLTKALVTDYFTDQRIWIKLNPDLNAADNAKKYYGKAKNEVIEVKKLLEQLETTETNLKDLELQLTGALASTDFKSLKSFQKLAPPVNNQIQDTLPYRLVEFQGYQIWVGKNNKSNDQMLKLAQKNDMWLHAKDVAGSHVIIKKKGSIYPDSVIQHAAQLAAKNSKAKTQSVVPVIAVLRKFVSKPKNAALGEVSVQKEEIVDAFIA